MREKNDKLVRAQGFVYCGHGTKTVGVLVKLSRLEVEGSLKGHMMSVPVKYVVEIAFDET